MFARGADRRACPCRCGRHRGVIARLETHQCLARAVADYPHTVVLEGVSRETLAETIMVLRDVPRLYLETHALRMPDALRLLRDADSIDRVLFGSDAPGMSLGAALRYVQGSDLTAEEQAAVLGGNAQKIWHGEE